MIDWQVSIGTISLAILWTTTALAAMAWLNNRFEKLLTRVEYIASHAEITKKLDYHEKHDDRRFEEVSNSLWLVRERMARSGINGGSKEDSSFRRTVTEAITS